jgi:hypothetical protein
MNRIELLTLMQAEALIDTQKDVLDLRDAVDLLIFKSRRSKE